MNVSPSPREDMKGLKLFNLKSFLYLVFHFWFHAISDILHLRFSSIYCRDIFDQLGNYYLLILCSMKLVQFTTDSQRFMNLSMLFLLKYIPFLTMYFHGKKIYIVEKPQIVNFYNSEMAGHNSFTDPLNTE
jgi:hypothetical protein